MVKESDISIQYCNLCRSIAIGNGRELRIIECKNERLLKTKILGSYI